MNAARGHTRGTAEGHALFLNPSERETGESTSRPTKMKVTEKVRALLRSVKPAVRRYATAHESRGFRSAWAPARQTGIRARGIPTEPRR